MTLHLTADHLNLLRSHAEATYPHECCGALLGICAPDGVNEVLAVRRLNNAWNADVARALAEPETYGTTRRYWIDPADLITVMREARSLGFDLIGIYHSHPDVPAIPSDCDRRLAWSTYSYPILSVQHGQTQDVRSWQLDAEQQFQPEAIVIQPSRVYPPIASG